MGAIIRCLLRFFTINGGWRGIGGWAVRRLGAQLPCRSAVCTTGMGIARSGRPQGGLLQGCFKALVGALCAQPGWATRVLSPTQGSYRGVSRLWWERALRAKLSPDYSPAGRLPQQHGLFAHRVGSYKSGIACCPHRAPQRHTPAFLWERALPAKLSHDYSPAGRLPQQHR